MRRPRATGSAAGSTDPNEVDFSQIFVVPATHRALTASGAL